MDGFFPICRHEVGIRGTRNFRKRRKAKKCANSPWWLATSSWLGPVLRWFFLASEGAGIHGSTRERGEQGGSRSFWFSHSLKPISMEVEA